MNFTLEDLKEVCLKFDVEYTEWPEDKWQGLAMYDYFCEKQGIAFDDEAAQTYAQERDQRIKEKNDAIRNNDDQNAIMLDWEATKQAHLDWKKKETICGLCGKSMPPGDEMFKFHGYSGPCPTED